MNNNCCMLGGGKHSVKYCAYSRLKYITPNACYGYTQSLVIYIE